MIKTPSSSFRSLNLNLAFGLALVTCLLVSSLNAQSLVQNPKDQWITIGQDAFSTLTAEPGLLFQFQPLHKEAETARAVLTRVHAADLPLISERMHELYARCPGFLAHANRAEGEAALAKALEPRPERGAITYTIDQPVLVQSLQGEIQTTNLFNTIDHLSNNYVNRRYETTHGTDAAIWIRDLWNGYAASRPDVTADLYDHSWAQSSVILTIPGTTLPDEVVVLGGHLDSTSWNGGSGNNRDAPGADDNASGIAALSEVIRAAMVKDFVPQRTVKIMGYSAEEVGLWGSQEIADDFANQGIDVVAVLQLDMTGYFGSVQDMPISTDVETNTELSNFLKLLLDTYQPNLTYTNTACNYGCSDHVSWHNAGYPAAFPFEAKFGEHNPEIHKTTDTLATIGNNADHVIKFSRLAAAFMVEIAVDGDASLIFVDGFESGDTSAWSEAAP